VVLPHPNEAPWRKIRRRLEEEFGVFMTGKAFMGTKSSLFLEPMLRNPNGGVPKREDLKESENDDSCSQKEEEEQDYINVKEEENGSDTGAKKRVFEWNFGQNHRHVPNEKRCYPVVKRRLCKAGERKGENKLLEAREIKGTTQMNQSRKRKGEGGGSSFLLRVQLSDTLVKFFGNGENALPRAGCGNI
ncbi:hypothetical protein HAX54_044888, partial [Datura stramonium]|nr:hypothetical protein [Datura stramonium]